MIRTPWLQHFNVFRIYQINKGQKVHLKENLKQNFFKKISSTNEKLQAHSVINKYKRVKIFIYITICDSYLLEKVLIGDGERRIQY